MDNYALGAPMLATLRAST